ncbi:MAG: hypothetical protein FWC29_02940 [Methanomassiliicoccaceae archaeon]|nr:hypothetical protein [Methanomassiliicoccaceae archaeon]
MIGTKKRKTLHAAIIMAVAIAAVAALGFAAIGSDSSEAAPQTVTMTIDDANGTGSVQYMNSGIWTDFGGSKSFESGTIVKIRAVSTIDDKFVWWAGGIAAIGEEYDLTVGAAPMSITAKFVDAVSTQWTELLISTSGNGTGKIQFEIPGTTLIDSFVDIPTGGVVYPVNESIKLRPRAITGTFIWWTGDLSGTLNVQTLLMDDSKFVAAEFYVGTLYEVTAYTTTTSTPPGVSKMQYWQNDAYQDFPAPSYAIMVPQNTVIEIKLDITTGERIGPLEKNGSPIPGESPVTVQTITSNTVIIAKVNTNSFNYMQVHIENHGSCSGEIVYSEDGSTWYPWLPINNTYNGGFGIPLDMTLYLKVAGTGTGTFVWWTGTKSGADTELTVSPGSNQNITAVFAENTYNVTATIEKFNGNGDGGKVQYKYGGIWSDFPASNILMVPSDIGTIEMRAVASTVTKNVFLWWAGDISGPINIQSLLVNSNKNITAVFNSNNPGDNRNVVVNVVGSGTVEVQNTGIWGAGNWQTVPVGSAMVIPNNQNMDFRATADVGVTGNKFVWWTGGLRGTDNPKTLLVDGNKTVTANFSNNTQSVNFTIEGTGKIFYLLDGTLEEAPAHLDVPMSVGTLQLRAEPDFPPASNEFIWWTGDVTGTVANASLGLSGSAKNVKALFSGDAFTVTATTSVGTMHYILDGKTFAFPAAGLRVPNNFAGIQLRVNGAVPVDWELGGVSLITNANPLSILVTGNQAYEATYTLPTWSITLVVGANGAASSNAADLSAVVEGSNVTFTFTPDSGYGVVDVLLDGVSKKSMLRGNMYVLNNVIAAHTVEVVFDVAVEAEYYIKASADSGATINPVGTVTVGPNENKTFYFSANPGKEITRIVIDGSVRNDLLGMKSYTFVQVMANHTIDVQTSNKAITLTVEIVGGKGTAEYRVAGSGNFVKYASQTAIPLGSNVAVHLVPSSGYEFKHWLDDGVVVGTEDTYMITGASDSVHLVAVLESADSSDIPWMWIAIVVLAIIAVVALAYGIIRYKKASNY